MIGTLDCTTHRIYFFVGCFYNKVHNCCCTIRETVISKGPKWSVIKANGNLSEKETQQNVLDKAAIVQKRSRKMISGANFPKVTVSVFLVYVVS